MKLRCALFWLAMLAHPVVSQVPADKSAVCTLQGQVLQEPGDRPFRKVKVQLISSAQDEPVTYSATTDPEGKFTISDIKAGQYRLSAEHTGFFLVDQKNRVIRSQTLTLQTGSELKDLILRMQPAGVITGKVLDGDGDPMSEVEVTATRYAAGSIESRPHGFGRTNDQGEYRMANLQPGRYLIAALSARDDSDETVEPEHKDNPKDNTTNHKRPQRSYNTYYPGSADRSQALPIEIHPGDEIPVNINMVFGPTFRVRGSVANLTNAPDADNDILLYPKDSNGWHDSYSAPEIKQDGSFEIRSVPPGLYYLAMKASTDAGAQSTFVQAIEVTDADIENLHVAAVPVSSVRGRLHLEGNEKNEWPGLVVALASDEPDSDLWRRFTGQMSFDASVNRDGSFEIQRVPAGTYRVLAWTSGSNFARDTFLQSIHLGGSDITNSGLKVNGGNYSLEIVMGAQGSAIEGAVLDAKDRPVAGATVVAIPDAARRGRTELYQTERADQQGKFQLHGLAPGEYELIAVEYLDEDYRDPEFLKQYQNSSLTIQLEKGERKTTTLKEALAAEK